MDPCPGLPKPMDQLARSVFVRPNLLRLVPGLGPNRACGPDPSRTLGPSQLCHRHIADQPMAESGSAHHNTLPTSLFSFQQLGFLPGVGGRLLPPRRSSFFPLILSHPHSSSFPYFLDVFCASLLFSLSIAIFFSGFVLHVSPVSHQFLLLSWSHFAA